MLFRMQSSLALGKALGSGSRLLRIGGGSTLPGRAALFLYPGFVSSMVKQLPLGCILITGTNGKTTTATLLASILDRAGITPVHNRTGANLMGGIASSLIRESNFSAETRGSIGLFEVDEAALPAAVAQTSPRLILVNNLFRDQLDRYGELDTLASRMKEAVGTLGPESTVVLNADDPLVSSIGSGLNNNVLYYGIDSSRYSTDTMQHAADSQHCSTCGSRLEYEYYLFGHMGQYHCPACGLKRPRTDIAAIELEMAGMKGTRITVRYPGGSVNISVPLPGLYNIYNILAAMSAAIALDIDLYAITCAIEEFTAAFGRVELVSVADRHILMILAKNPAGFNEVIRTLSGEAESKTIVLALNDNIADGRDVSWIWDADIEMFRGALDTVVCTGIRAADMALRVKYAELGERSTVIEPDLARALDAGLEAVPPGGTLYLVPTYTAMLDLRKILAKRGLVTPYWEG